MSIASLRSKLSNITKNNAFSDVAITKKIESLSSNFKSNPTILARDLIVEGKITSSSVIEIEGSVKGSVSGNSIILREEGLVEGDIFAESLNIRGKFNGNIRAKNISITAKARITGVIEYGSLSVEDGACIDGKFKQI